ncbi:MAG: hypothetical protein CMJ48_13290 [Planctomycetaceae bacterium]|nr:hypothetical protein [Planctomycetaceae bacterium]
MPNTIERWGGSLTSQKVILNLARTAVELPTTHGDGETVQTVATSVNPSAARQQTFVIVLETVSAT